MGREQFKVLSHRDRQKSPGFHGERTSGLLLGSCCCFIVE